MKKINVYIYDNETDIERNDSSVVIMCEERICSIPALMEIIKYHWGLDKDDYVMNIRIEGGSI